MLSKERGGSSWSVGGFDCEILPKLWYDVCYMLIKNFTLEGRFKCFFYYHFALLNHFHHSKVISFPFYLLSSLETSILKTIEQHTPHPAPPEAYPQTI